MPRLSIFLPVRNAQAYIGRCVESLRKQSFEDWHAIVTDDASTDATWERAVVAAGSDPRIAIVRNAERLRKVGVFLATFPRLSAEIIVELDGDDHFCSDNALVEIVACYDANPKVDATSGRHRSSLGYVSEDYRGQTRPSRWGDLRHSMCVPRSWRRSISEQALEEMPEVFYDDTGKPWASAGDLAIFAPALYYARRIGSTDSPVYEINAANAESDFVTDRHLQEACADALVELWRLKVAAKPPYFSIFSATRNSERWAAACIGSIRSQDFTSWELVYVDDASTDATSAVVSAASDGDQRIRLITNSERIGKVANFLAVWPHLRGEVILIVDGDDNLSRTDSLSLIRTCYEADSEIEATFGRIVGHDKPLTMIDPPRYAATIRHAWMPHSWSRGITERAMTQMPHVFNDPKTGCPWESGGDIVLSAPAMCFARKIADVGHAIYAVSGSREGDTPVQIDCITRCRKMWVKIEREMFGQGVAAPPPSESACSTT